MQRYVWIWMLGGGLAALLTACESIGTPTLTADQIVEKNVQARGGLKAWQDIQTMVWVGHISSQHTPGGSLPFVLEMKRPDKTRFEIRAQGQVAVRIFNGIQGWTLRPARGGVPALQPYTKYEVKYARDADGIGGPLVDYATRGITVTLAGVEELDGHKAYRLAVKLPSGTFQQMWIDAKTFLTVKYERESRNAVGVTGRVSVYYSNYQTFDGVRLPLTIESGTDNSPVRDTMNLDRVVINPRLPDWVFSKPLLPPHPPTVSIGGQEMPLQWHH